MRKPAQLPPSVSEAAPETPIVLADPVHPLFGVLHSPRAHTGARVGVLLLNPGLKSRVAPNRLNVVLARDLATRGYSVFRLDPPGVGDSFGDLPEDRLVDLWQKIQRGFFVSAVSAVAAEFQRACELDEVVLMGNCGGAITALLQAGEASSIRRLVLIDIPVTLRASDEGTRGRIVGKGHSKRILLAYLRRAKDWRAWTNLIRMKTDVHTVGRAIAARFGGNTRRTEEPAAVTGSATVTPGEVLNWMFIEAFRAFDRRGGRALFVTAGNDANTFAFDEHFGQIHGDAWTGEAARHTRVTIPEANHIYGAPEWRDALIRAVTSWLERG